jgi:FlaA1/EpsC-like NDP-sugar epimerase
VQLGSLFWRKQCKGLLSFFSLPELRQVVTALGFASLLLLGLSSLTDRSCPPRNLIIVNLLLSLCLLSGLRLLLRLWREDSSVIEYVSPPLRVGIIGAGITGSQLARELNVKRRSGRTVVAFFDDDFQKWQRRLHEVPVVGMPECLLEGWAEKLDEVIIATPHASANRLCEIGELLQKVGLRAYIAPPPLDLWPKNKA